MVRSQDGLRRTSWELFGIAEELMLSHIATPERPETAWSKVRKTPIAGKKKYCYDVFFGMGSI
jgi:hypothetical protein